MLAGHSGADEQRPAQQHPSKRSSTATGWPSSAPLWPPVRRVECTAPRMRYHVVCAPPRHENAQSAEWFLLQGQHRKSLCTLPSRYITISPISGWLTLEQLGSMPVYSKRYRRHSFNLRIRGPIPPTAANIWFGNNHEYYGAAPSSCTTAVNNLQCLTSITCLQMPKATHRPHPVSIAGDSGRTMRKLLEGLPDANN
jgi:hypothetical protein